jgi:glutamine synthetase
MVGSSQNISCPNFILNTIVAESLSQFADILEKATDFNAELDKLIRKTIKAHKRIIFNGNSYSKEWFKEAKKRGLSIYPTTVDALPRYVDEKNVKLFEKHKVLNKSEMYSRMEILLENYANIIHIEALTMLDMARKEITPAVIGYQSYVLEEANAKREFSKRTDSKLHYGLEKSLIFKLSGLADKFSTAIDNLEIDIAGVAKAPDTLKKAQYCKTVLLKDMFILRSIADDMELLIGKKFYSIPTYEDILYSVKY